jgi:hypothetical protein
MKRCFADLGYVSVGGAKDTRSAIRRAAYRIGRKLYMAGHMDLSNRPATNGEYWVVDQVLPLIPPDSIVLDIGANKGRVDCLRSARRFGFGQITTRDWLRALHRHQIDADKPVR